MFLREYVLKIVLTGSIFQLQIHQIPFGGRALPGPAGGAYRAPQTTNWIKVNLLLKEGVWGGSGGEKGRRGWGKEN